MGFFSPRYQITEVSPAVIGFFFTQYVELMKHGKDKTDLRMKDYLFSVITGLGVPSSDFELIEESTGAAESAAAPIINRR